jgi:hypothetical protein
LRRRSWLLGVLASVSASGFLAAAAGPVEVFQQLLAIQLDRTEVSIETASALLAESNRLKRRGSRYFMVAAPVALGVGDRDQARILAGKLMEASGTPADKQWSPAVPGLAEVTAGSGIPS